MPEANERRGAEKAILLLMALAVLAISLTKTLSIAQIQGQDFWAYHQAGERFLRGENPYVASDIKAYKYAPTLLPLFALFALFPLPVALWVFAAVNAVVLCALPLAAVRLFERGGRFRSRDRAWALGLGLVASLRFVDGEVYNAQINGWSLACLLGAVACWTSAKPRPAAGAMLYALGAFFKFHPLFGLGAFLAARAWKTCLLLVAAASLVAAVPNPGLWLSLARQLRVTTPMIASHGMSTVYQGFYGLFSNFFNLRQGSAWPFAAFAAVAALTLPWVPKFGLCQDGPAPARNPAAFMLALAALLLLAVTASPLPWQHTYLVWGSFVPLAYLAGTPAQRRLVAGLACAMGLSARGIAGFAASNWLELHQSIFALSLALVGVLILQSRRFAAK